MAKYAGKYETPEEMEKAYLEAQRLITERAEAVKQLEGQAQQQAQALAELAHFAQSMAPLAAWYRSNRDWVAQEWERRARASQQPQPGGYPQGGYPQYQAPAGWDQLDPRQQFSAMVTASGSFAQQQARALLAQEAPKMYQRAMQDLQGRLKNGMDVVWRTVEKIGDPEKLKLARSYHERALQFTDPNNLNPMDLANQSLEMEYERDKYKTELAALTKQNEERERAQVASLGARSSARAFERGPAEDKIPTREERMAQAFKAVQEEHGDEGLRVLTGHNAA